MERLKKSSTQALIAIDSSASSMDSAESAMDQDMSPQVFS
jgi:hypothetical protein